MNKWLLVVGLGVLAHFGASFLVPLEEKDQGQFGGLLRWLWPWSAGDRGVMGTVDPAALPTAALFLAMAAAALCAMAALAVLGIWVPAGWSRGLAIGGAALLVVLMVGFFGPTKVLPIVAALAMAWAAIAWRIFQTT